MIGLGWVLAVLLIGGTVTLWRLPDLLNIVARKYLPTGGLEEVRVEVRSAGLRSLELFAVAAGPGWELRVGAVRAEYSLMGLMRRQKADLVVVERLNLAVEMPLAAEEGLSFLGESDEADTDPFDLSWIKQWPSERIEVRDATIAVSHDDYTGTVQVNGTAAVHDNDSLTIDLQLALADLHARLSGNLQHQEPSQLRLNLTAPDLLGVIAGIIPDWRQRWAIAPEVQLAVTETRLDTTFILETDQSFAINGQLNVALVNGTFETAALHTENLQLDLALDSHDRVIVNLAADSVSVEWNALSLSANPLQLSVASDDLVQWKVDWHQPLNWAYEDVLARGAIAASVSVKTAHPETGFAFSTVLESRQFEVGEYALQPWQLTINGTPEVFAFACSPLRLIAHPEEGLENLSGTVHLSAHEDRFALDAKGRVAADSLTPWLPQGAHSAILLGVNARSNEGAVDFELQATTTGEEVLVRFPDVFAASGDVALAIKGRRDSADGRWSSQLSLEGSGPTIAGNDWHGEGWALSTEVAVSGLDPGQLSDASEDFSVWGDPLGHVLSVQADWQANGLYSDWGAAQWLSGEMTLNPPTSVSGAPFDLELTARAGLVQLLEESFQQLELSVRTEGNAAALKGAGNFDFWYGGSPGNVSFSHQWSGAFMDPDIAGHYNLTPFVFDYSDIAGRYFPQLESLSFSGTLAADGSFWLRDGAADASVEAAFSQGSFDFPASQVAVEGVSAVVGLTSVIEKTGRPDGSWVNIARLKAGDLTATNGRLTFSLHGANTLRLSSGGIEMFGGKILLDPTEILLDPLGFEGTVRFERLSLEALTAQMSFFDGTMEGTVSGFMPFHYSDGQLTPQEGLLQLPKEETARLRYNSRGLFSTPEREQSPESPPNFRDRMSTGLLRILKLEPEKVVEDALANLLITQLRIELFPADTPNTPVRIQFAGEAESGGTRVPMHLETNVNGTLDELYNFLIRLNSLGSTSF